MLASRLTKMAFSFIAAFAAAAFVMFVDADDFDDNPAARAVFVDVYDFSMQLRVPRIYDNGRSLGVRKYQS